MSGCLKKILPSYFQNIVGVFILILLLNHSMETVSSYQVAEDGRYLEKRSHELATWLLSQLNQAPEYQNDYPTSNQAELCQTTQPNVIAKRHAAENNYLYRLNASKRNSELINSLLRLPKTMNEVGRK